MNIFISQKNRQLAYRSKDIQQNLSPLMESILFRNKQMQIPILRQIYVKYEQLMKLLESSQMKQIKEELAINEEKERQKNVRAGKRSNFEFNQQKQFDNAKQIENLINQLTSTDFQNILANLNTNSLEILRKQLLQFKKTVQQFKKQPIDIQTYSPQSKFKFKDKDFQQKSLLDQQKEQKLKQLYTKLEMTQSQNLNLRNSLSDKQKLLLQLQNQNTLLKQIQIKYLKYSSTIQQIQEIKIINDFLEKAQYRSQVKSKDVQPIQSDNNSKSAIHLSLNLSDIVSQKKQVIEIKKSNLKSIRIQANKQISLPTGKSQISDNSSVLSGQESSSNIIIDITQKFNSLDQQNSWLSIKKSIGSTKFKSGSPFTYPLYENACQLLKYLWELAKEQIIKYIAIPLWCSKTVLKQHSFDAKLEKGKRVQISKSWIQEKGQIYIFRWIIDIALGICEMQKFNIYHADLAFRNTILVERESFFNFKIIDFDIAFNTSNQKKHKSFECLKNIFQLWLRTEKDQNDIIDHIFRGANQSQIKKIMAIKKQSQIVQKVDQCLSRLRSYMPISHISQYSALVQNLLKAESQNQMSLKNDLILKELIKLKAGQINLGRFVDRVRVISGINQHDQVPNAL